MSFSLLAARSRRAFSGVLIGGIAVPVAAFLPAAATAAHAAIEGAQCTGTQELTHSPGLTDTPRPVTVTGTSTLVTCASSDQSITSGTSTLSASGTFSCTSGTGPGIRKITWNNGQTSTLPFTRTISTNLLGQTVAKLAGVVSEGEFKGYVWNGTFILFSTKPSACSTPEGLTSASGPLVLTITKP